MTSTAPTELPSRAEVARLIDHTLLKPEATPADVVALCREAGELGVFAVCVSPSMVTVAHEALPAGVALATVCGFPSGAHDPRAKAHEAGLAVTAGAIEVDMVIDLGRAKAGEWSAVEADIATVRAATSGSLLKVIIEAAALTEDEIVAACRAAENAGADYVKTSTGFHPTGGASTSAVALMAATVGDRLGVKASGGIRTAADAAAMVAAGATRIGCSASAAILAGLPE
ncbi:MAG: deoxyribose-phosphate aldolase [Motilibacteraceae bacterium]